MTTALSLQQQARIALYRSGAMPPAVLVYRLPAGTDVPHLLRAAELVGSATEAWCRRFDVARGRARTVEGSEAVEVSDVGAVEAESLAAVLQEPFDVASGPLARAYAGRACSGEVLLGLAVDRIVWDCRSTGVTTRQIAATYERLDAGDTSPPLASGASYRSFVERQRSAWEGLWGEGVRRYWASKIERFGSYPPTFTAPVRAEGTHGARNDVGCDVQVDGYLDAGLLADVQARCQRLRISRYAYLLAAVLVALRKLDPGLAGVLVDTPSRAWPEYAETVGLFSHGVPIWDEGAADGTLDELAARLHDYVGVTLGHAVPLPAVLAATGLGVQARGGVAPLVVFEDPSIVPSDSFARLGGALAGRPDALGPADLDGRLLVLRFHDVDGGLGVRVQASSSELEADDGRQLLDLLVSLV